MIYLFSLRNFVGTKSVEHWECPGIYLGICRPFILVPWLFLSSTPKFFLPGVCPTESLLLWLCQLPSSAFGPPSSNLHSTPFPRHSDKLIHLCTGFISILWNEWIKCYRFRDFLVILDFLQTHELFGEWNQSLISKFTCNSYTSSTYNLKVTLGNIFHACVFWSVTWGKMSQIWNFLLVTTWCHSKSFWFGSLWILD